MNKKALASLAAVMFFLVPQAAYAHSFGKLYSLPIPFWLYLYGGAAALLVSFLVIGYFIKQKSQDFAYTSINLSRFRPFVTATKPWFLTTLKFLSVSLFFLTILTGLLGANNSSSNFNMTFFWIIFTLGLTYLTAIIGNIYSVINPWKALADLFEAKKDGLFKYPKWLAYYPALIFYFLFIWFELVGHIGPAQLSSILVVYTFINGLGVITFGKEIWFHYCEFFSVFFRLISKIAPIEYKEGKLHLRPPFIGLLKEKAEHFSLLLFTLFMLSSTAFDGFKETIPWVNFYWSHLNQALTPILGANAYPIFQTIGLLLSPFVFLAIYLLTVWLSKIVAKSTLSSKELALQFAFSLIPITLAYNIAHYFTLIFTEGPNIISLISNPFDLGWNLFGTASFYKSIILGANFVWHSQVAFILLGHILSVYLSHLVALNTFTSRKTATISQFPMLILMVTYTMIGLWILSQPITGA